MDEISIPELTNEFVSTLIGKKVSSFTIKPGSAPGDNYMSVLYCLKCILAPESGDNYNGPVSVVYGISKCYPAHPTRQQFLNKSNIFWNELSVYKEWIPALKKFRAQYGSDPQMDLPFVPLITGEAVNFGTGEETEKMLKKYEGKIFEPFDIFIMMVDMKNTFGFRLADRMIGLGLEEMNLVMREYAKIHALSWAYKVKNGNEDISIQFPFLKMDMKEEDMEMWMNMMTSNVQSAYETLSKITTPEESEMLVGLARTKGRMREIMDSIFIPGETGAKLQGLLRVKTNWTEDERRIDDVPWQVIVHGDCWVNNLLFRYDPVTNKPLEVVLIDLQVMREACPTSDLGYAIYSSTSSQLRQKHLKDFLRLYADQFMFHCDDLGVPYLPGFSYESLMRRFHRSKLMGFIMGLIVLPVMLKDAKQAVNLDSYEGDGNIGEILTSAMGVSEGNVVYKERLHALVKEMYEGGVI